MMDVSMDLVICLGLHTLLCLTSADSSATWASLHVAVISCALLPSSLHSQLSQWIVGLLLLPQLGVAVTAAAGGAGDAFSSGQLLIVLASVAILLPLFSKELNIISLCPIFGLSLLLPWPYDSPFDISNIAVCAAIVVAIHLLRQVPIKLSCFESGVITQAVLLMLWACHHRMANTGVPQLGTDSMFITALGMVSVILLVLTLLAAEPLLNALKKMNLLSQSSTITVLLLHLGTGIAVMVFIFYKAIDKSPVTWIIQYLNQEAHHRLLICNAWVLAIGVGVPLIPTVINKYELRHSTARKLFHFLSVCLFAPVIILDIDMMALSFGVALSILLLLEWFRLVCHSYELSDSVNQFFDQFIDERDTSRGIAVTHLYLLLGCAAPVWATVYIFSLAELTDEGYSVRNNSFENRDLKAIWHILPHLGWIIVGIGDSFGAIIGKAAGRVKWSEGNSKTLVGSVGMLGSMLLCLVLLLLVHGLLVWCATFPAMTALFVATIAEAFTDEIDNILLPLFGVNCFLVIKSTISCSRVSLPP